MAVVLYGSSDGPQLVTDEYGRNSWSDGQNLGRTSNYAGDPYGGIPINITSGNAAASLNSTGIDIGSGLEGLYEMIMNNTDRNNAWSAAQAQKQMDFQERMNSIAMEFNSQEAAKNRDWQEMMSNTAHQREIADLKAAGLNPVLSASGGNGASVGSGATASGVTSSGAMADADQSGNSALASIYGALISAQTQMYNANLSAQTNLAIADRQVEANMYAAQLAANASMYGSTQAYNASVYNADTNYKNNEAQRDWNAAHPDTIFRSLFSDSVQGLIDNGRAKGSKVADFIGNLLGMKSGSSAKMIGNGKF